MTLLPTKPNQTRPTQATSQPRKGKGLNAHPHVTKIYKTLTLIACGVVFGLHETKIQAAEKKANIYKEEGGEKYHQDYRYTGMGASMMSYIWQKMNYNWVRHREI